MLLLDVDDVALRIEDTELFDECGVLIRGEARLSVRGDFGGTSGGIALKPSNVSGLSAWRNASGPTTLGMINGLRSFCVSTVDLLPIPLSANSSLAE